MLLARNDFVIIDFEGEPGRSFAERRAKQSPLRDVAGMLRSFSYAGLSALLQVVPTAEARAALLPFVTQWQREVRHAFLDAYDGVAGGRGLYVDFEEGRGLLGLFELEKALYELRYELNNRPDWVAIPLQGILDLVGAA